MKNAYRKGVYAAVDGIEGLDAKMSDAQADDFIRGKAEASVYCVHKLDNKKEPRLRQVKNKNR
jgi:hypothetical protein